MLSSLVQIFRCGPLFLPFRKTTLLTYATAGCDAARLREFRSKSNLRDLFQEAFMNYVGLQPIVYDDAFACCEGSLLTADGMMFGNKRCRSYLTKPWAANPQGPVVGCPQLTL